MRNCCSEQRIGILRRTSKCSAAHFVSRSNVRPFTHATISHPRLSKFFLPSGSVASAAGERESTTDLLIRAGFIRKSSAGIYSLLPLGIFVQRKLAAIIHRNMYMAGASEVSLPSLLSPAAWKTTGRWENTELYKLKDSSDSEFCLAPTHEEEITSLVSREITSFRQLPLRLYQIGRKYRDEMRPRGGMLRGREFVMMDLYTFDTTTETALSTYEEIRVAYRSIFDTIGIKYAVSEADSGSIGGDLSHEFHYITPVGEDTLITCDSCDYTANVEVAVSYPSGKHVYDPDKVAVKYGLTTDSTLLVIYYPPDRVVNENLIKKELPTYDRSVRNPVSEFTRNGDPMLQRIIRIFDERVSEKSSLPDLPVSINIGNITTIRFPCVEVAPQSHPKELCPHCEDGALLASRAVEVGHTFYLSTKYSAALKAHFTAEDGAKKPIEMGCYGIGVSRIISAVAEVTRDYYGLSWPVAICPFEVVIVTKPKSDKIYDLAIKLYQDLRKTGCEAVIDDRDDKSFGWKLSDSKFLGFPVSVVVGNNYLKDGRVDVECRRTGQSTICSPEQVADTVAFILQIEKTTQRSSGS
ncbi:hypothetical protein V1520DRAFT_337473 [Lipomyces starkeyi]|uniref:proline--tRNA ligase n=1 Tax=Lipomyces starkeyi NRRL Y-11557 TaxID=675824 RepID=A0A1E3QC95_LIPST|nr:hypothetical protein LIPSTDRAFT_69441 [Lipomyces starkeyi NRRL Y-11557]